MDFALISHDHYDHLDVDTVQRLARTHHPLFLVPLGLKAWFADIGITEVEEMDWWESLQVRRLTVTSNRLGLELSKAWVLKHGETRGW